MSVVHANIKRVQQAGETVKLRHLGLNHRHPLHCILSHPLRVSPTAVANHVIALPCRPCGGTASGRTTLLAAQVRDGRAVLFGCAMLQRP